MSRELREGLAFLEAVCLTMYFIGRLDLADAEGLGTLEACERLVTLQPAGPAAWRLLARVVRHVLGTLEERDDPRALLLRELHTEVMAYADRAAACAPQTGE